MEYRSEIVRQDEMTKFTGGNRRNLAVHFISSVSVRQEPHVRSRARVFLRSRHNRESCGGSWY